MNPLQELKVWLEDELVELEKQRRENAIKGTYEGWLRNLQKITDNKRFSKEVNRLLKEHEK